jgi:hypothetical protein
MALVVFLRGVNVGGHKTFRPSLLADELSDFDVVNLGAAGTFVVRKRISRAKLRAELLRRLPFATEVVIVKGADVLKLASGNPFAGQSAGPKIVRFVSILAKPGQSLSSIPLNLPSAGKCTGAREGSQTRYLALVPGYGKDVGALRNQALDDGDAQVACGAGNDDVLSGK